MDDILTNLRDPRFDGPLNSGAADEIARLRAVLRRISVTVQTAAEEDDLYTTPKQSRDSLCKALSREIRETLALPSRKPDLKDG